MLASLRSASDGIATAVTRALRSASDCVPEDAVALSYINTAMVPMREKQTPGCAGHVWHNC